MSIEPRRAAEAVDFDAGEEPEAPLPSADDPARGMVVGEAAPATTSHRAAAHFHVPPHVLAVAVAEAVVLMDCRSGTYYTLSQVSARIWTLVRSGVSRGQILARLVGEYEVGLDQLDADVESTLNQLLGARLIAAGPERTTRSHEESRRPAGAQPVLDREVRVPSVARCLLALLTVKLALRTSGFGRTLAWVKRRVGTIPPSSTVSIKLIRSIEHAVAMAGALYPGRALCLEQSLVLYYILRRQGVRVTYCQGVQPHPFQAHAWIEYQGVVINDVAEHVKIFSRFPDVLP